MKTLDTNQTVKFNPPLRIFNTTATGEGAVSASRFARPKLKSLVNHDRVARYFTRRGFSFGSSLD